MYPNFTAIYSKFEWVNNQSNTIVYEIIYWFNKNPFLSANLAFISYYA